MMLRRIFAIVFIFACTSAAWAVLGATIFARSESLGSGLKARVASTWGSAQVQTPPSAAYERDTTELVERTVDGKKILESATRSKQYPLPLEKSDVSVAFDLEHRQKGLLWYSTYKVDFSGTYVFHNTSGQDETVQVQIKFPAERAVYDDYKVLVGGSPVEVRSTDSCVSVEAKVAAGRAFTCTVAYKSQGLDSWTYRFGTEVTQVKDFALQMRTNFDDIDFPENTLSPTEKRPVAGGWELGWRYRNLLSGYDIGMIMPQKLQPGPLAGQISLFAPVSLFFFFFLMFTITTLRDIELHPMNYFFLAAAFFSFHLLLAYLVDHVSIHLAFAICSLVSILLVVSYLRLVVGMRFAAVEAGISQFIYLVLFSYAFFFKGFTGLAVTIGSILTLFVVMQMTGRIRWA
ncbi:MAG: inner membrane CreD family protein [Acidobacteria bacterium]|nr:inner membrane CreD family protein [Acidobacteriota bacterium]